MHMLALGRLCVVSAYVDRLLTDLIQVFLGCTDAQAAIIGTENDKAAARCNIIKKLAAEASPSPEWRVALDQTIKRLLSYGEKRNRYVHDCWSLTSGSLERLERRATVRKPQSFELSELTFDTRHVTPPDEVTDVAVQYAITAVCLLGATKDLETWKLEGNLPKPSLLITTDQARVRHAAPNQSPDQEHRE